MLVVPHNLSIAEEVGIIRNHIFYQWMIYEDSFGLLIFGRYPILTLRQTRSPLRVLADTKKIIEAVSFRGRRYVVHPLLIFLKSFYISYVEDKLCGQLYYLMFTILPIIFLLYYMITSYIALLVQWYVSFM